MVTVSRGRTVKADGKVDHFVLARIIGSTCVAGFLSDILVAAMPVALRSFQWRMNLLQQIGDRGIILLFGLSLLALSYAGKRLWSKRIGLLSLIIGVFFLLSSIAFIRDSLVMQKATNGAVDGQVSELQSRIKEQTSRPEFQNQATPDEVQAATQRIAAQAETYKQTIKSGTVRTGLSAMSNLLIMGVAFVSLGRYCMQTRRTS